jgi:hypothetical protein
MNRTSFAEPSLVSAPVIPAPGQGAIPPRVLQLRKLRLRPR